MLLTCQNAFSFNIITIKSENVFHEFGLKFCLHPQNCSHLIASHCIRSWGCRSSGSGIAGGRQKEGGGSGSCRCICCLVYTGCHTQSRRLDRVHYTKPPIKQGAHYTKPQFIHGVRFFLPPLPNLTHVKICVQIGMPM